MAAQLLSERRDRTLLLTISDPASRNALAEPVLTAGIEALNQAEADADVRCVVVQGAGGHFCAGGNLNGLLERRQAGPAAQARMLAKLNQFVEALHDFPKPVLAAVEGAAAGAGFSLALGCDLIVAARDARFVLSYARIGLSPDGGASWQLARALPAALVKQWIWLAEPVDAQRLHEAGIVSRVTAPGEALAEALHLAGQLGAMAPNALTSAKQLVQSAGARTLHQQLDAEAEHLIRNLFHDNAGEGLKAFFEKRAPRFQ
jgi:enoyl-CoA hydratase/carnithine racemase